MRIRGLGWRRLERKVANMPPRSPARAGSAAIATIVIGAADLRWPAGRPTGANSMLLPARSPPKARPDRADAYLLPAPATGVDRR